MTKIIIIIGLLFICTVNNLIGQRLFGVVVDKNDAPISYVNITIKNGVYNNYGWITDEKGTFEILENINLENDSILFSCIGFNKKVIAFKDLKKNNSNKIVLNSISYELNEVFVNAKELKRTIKEIGYHNNRTYAGDFFPLHNELSVLIENNNRKNGYLKSIKIKLRKRELGLKNRIRKRSIDDSPMVMRMHVYSASESERGPQDELLKESVIVNIDTNKKWIVVDMEKYHIEFPQEGLFVGFRYLPANNKTISDLIEGCPINAYPTFRIQRGFIRKKENCNTWVKYYKKVTASHGKTFYPGQWYFEGDNGNYHPNAGKTNAILSAEIIFYE